MEKLEKEFLNAKYLETATTKLMNYIKDEDITKDTIDFVYNNLKDKKNKQNLSSLDEGKYTKFRNFYVFKLEGIYTAFTIRQSEKLDNEKKAKYKNISKEIENHFKDNKKPLSDLAKQYSTEKIITNSSELNLYLEKKARENIDSLKSMGLNITKFKALPLQDKIVIVEKITNKSFVNIFDNLEQKKYFSILIDRKINIKDCVMNNLMTTYKKDIESIEKFKNLLIEDFEKNFLYVYSEVKNINKNAVININEIKNRINFAKNTNFSILKRKTIIKYILEKNYSEENELFILSLNKEKFYNDFAQEDTQKIIMFLDKNVNKLKWDIEEFTDMNKKTIKKNKLFERRITI